MMYQKMYENAVHNGEIMPYNRGEFLSWLWADKDMFKVFEREVRESLFLAAVDFSLPLIAVKGLAGELAYSFEKEAIEADSSERNPYRQSIKKISRMAWEVVESRVEAAFQ